MIINYSIFLFPFPSISNPIQVPPIIPFKYSYPLNIYYAFIIILESISLEVPFLHLYSYYQTIDFLPIFCVISLPNQFILILLLNSAFSSHIPIYCQLSIYSHHFNHVEISCIQQSIH